MHGKRNTGVRRVTIGCLWSFVECLKEEKTQKSVNNDQWLDRIATETEGLLVPKFGHYQSNSITIHTYVHTDILKVKVHTPDIAPLRSETPPQKRSGMARVLKGSHFSHSFTCIPTRSSAIGMSHTCLCLPSRSWYSFSDPRGMEG